MVIQSTLKDSTNDYFANTETLAIVHLTRLIEEDDVTNENAPTVIEELGVIRDFLIQGRKANDGQMRQVMPIVTFSGNTLTIEQNTTGYDDGDIFTIFVIGKR